MQAIDEESAVGLFRRLFGKPTIDEFGAEFVRALKNADPSSNYRHEPAEQQIIRARAGKKDSVFSLANMHQTHLAIPRLQRGAHLMHCVRVALSSDRQPPADFGEARPNLRSRLWSRAGLEQLRLRNLYTESDKGGLDLPCQPIGEHLLACLAYDWPESVQSVNQETLQEWGVTTYEALESALENLERSTQSVAQIGDRVYSFVSGDTYDAARIMLVDRIKGFELDGAPVAMVPNRELILITGSEDPAGLKIMADIAADGLRKPYPLSGIPLILQDGEWIDWMPPPGISAHAQFRQFALNFLGGLYAEQKELLDAAHERGGIDVFVASFSPKTRQDGTMDSYCVWGDGVDSLLPVARRIAFVREGPQLVGVGEWDRVSRIVGGLMEPTEHYPPLYRVREFPDQVSLDAMELAGEL